MIIKNLDMVFKTLEGRDMLINVVDNEPDANGRQKITPKKITLRDAITSSLLSDGADGRPSTIAGAEKARRYFLATKIHQAKEQVELSVDDAKLIKDEIGKVYPPLVVGQAYAVLDPEDKPAA